MTRVIKFEGRTINVPDDFTDAEVAKVLAAGSPAAASVKNVAGAVARSADSQPNQSSGIGPDEVKRRKYLAQMAGYGGNTAGPAGNMFTAATEGSQAGVMGGYDDEIGAAMTAPINAAVSAMQGNGFDIAKEYAKTQALKDARKAQRREAYPGTSIAGEVAGALALPGMVRAAPAAIGPSLGVPAISRMPTLIGRDLPLLGKVGATAAEGAGYGALYGSGEAKPGERLQGAETGALTGAALGTALHGAGSLLSKALPKPTVVPAPAAEDMAGKAQAIYKQIERSGIKINPEKITTLKQNVDGLLGATIPELAPKAYGLQTLIERRLSTNPSIGELHNIAKNVNMVLRSNLEGADAHYVPQIKTTVENMIENIDPAKDLTGANTTDLFKAWKQADALWAKQKKTEVINNILDTADVKTGQYTQSGLANTIRKQMDKLYTSIKNGHSKGWTDEEIALIRQMAKGGSNSQVINLLSKFAPRGAVSAVAGAALGGPGLMLGGHIAGTMADRGAVNAATTLRDAAARGYTLPIPIRPNRLAPFIPGVVAPSRANDLLSGK